MRRPLIVRPLTDVERAQVVAGLRSPDAFVLRRCQILLASARGEHVPQIAQTLGYDRQTVRNTIRAFNTSGLTCLQRTPSRPRTIHAAFDAARVVQLCGLLHESPRRFGKSTDQWTLDLAADVSVERGLTPKRVTGETIRATLARLGVPWQRAKQWVTHPDAEYLQRLQGPRAAGLPRVS